MDSDTCVAACLYEQASKHALCHVCKSEVASHSLGGSGKLYCEQCKANHKAESQWHPVRLDPVLTKSLKIMLGWASE